MSRVLWLALLAVPLLAQSDLYVDISGGWRFSPTHDDSLANAQPGFNDTGWRTVDTSRSDDLKPL